jgi:hypothetical protein
MAKEFHTERDIEDMFKRGIMSLNINENVVLTELAYEKANRLGMQLVRGQPENPPSAPVRPYLSQPASAQAGYQATSPAQAFSSTDVHGRIKEAAMKRLGNQVDPALLDIIIERVLKSTGVR